MALKVDATFEDGVFVPARRPVLAHGDRVRLTIEPAAPTVAATAGSSQGDSLINPGSRTDHALALALDFHPDGC
jgi:predicted DNA-binding antitoxin AbrB/MazE fold protein